MVLKSRPLSGKLPFLVGTKPEEGLPPFMSWGLVVACNCQKQWDLEIVGPGDSEELKRGCCHTGKRLCPGQVSHCRLLYVQLVSNLFTQVLAEKGSFFVEPEP